MMSDLKKYDEDASFVFDLAAHPARLLVGLVAGAILCLAGAAIQISSQLSSELPPKPAEARVEPAWSGTLVRARDPLRQDAAWIAYAKPEPVPRKPVQALGTAAQGPARINLSQANAPAARRSRQIARLIDGSSASRPSRHATRVRFILTRLDADGVVEEAPPEPHDPASRPQGGRANVQTIFHRLAGGAVDVDSGFGRVTTAARAGTLFGQPAAALNIGLSQGGIRFDAAGMTEMATLPDPAAMRKAFKVSTGASIPLD